MARSFLKKLYKSFRDMAEEIQKYRIPLFDGTNYSNWKFRMETLLNEADLLKYVEEDHSEMVEFSDDDNEEQKAKKSTTSHGARKTRS